VPLNRVFLCPLNENPFIIKELLWTEDLNEKKEHRLRISSYILPLITYGILQNTKMNIIVQGLIFGLLLSFRDGCFKKDSNEQF